MSPIRLFLKLKIPIIIKIYFVVINLISTFDLCHCLLISGSRQSSEKFAICSNNHLDYTVIKDIILI